MEDNLLTFDQLRGIAFALNKSQQITLETLSSLLENSPFTLKSLSTKVYEQRFPEFINTENTQEAYHLREMIVDRLTDKIGPLKFPRLLELEEEVLEAGEVFINEDYPCSERIGAQGFIVDDVSFVSPKCASVFDPFLDFMAGTFIEETDPEIEMLYLHFPNQEHYDGYYDKKYLSSVLGHEERKKDQEINQTILKNVKELSFTQFVSDLETQVSESIAAMDFSFPNLVPRRFDLGDEVITNSSANSNYALSKEGSVGLVTKILEDDFYEVKFLNLTGSDDDKVGFTFEMQAANLDLKIFKDLAENKSDVKEYVQALVQKAINDSLAAICIENYKENIHSTFVAELKKSGLFVSIKDGSFILDNNVLFRYLAPKLYSAYSTPELYSSKDMFSPPSERRPHVLRLELTTGCNYQKCTFCDGYKSISVAEKSFDEFMLHYNQVLALLGEDKSRIKRLFIGGGNALSAQQDTLLKVTKQIYADFHPWRIGTYGRTDAIIEKGVYNLRSLSSAGLSLIYWGVESGSDEVLKYVCKNTTVEEMEKAGTIAADGNMQLSVMVMPGLGGIKYYDEHVKGTANLLNSLPTRYITFMAVNPNADSVYSRKMQADHGNRPLTDQEIVQQVQEILGMMVPNSQKVGMFGCGIDQVGKNPIEFNLTFDLEGQKDALYICKKFLEG